jgi:outer membrane protein
MTLRPTYRQIVLAGGVAAVGLAAAWPLGLWAQAPGSLPNLPAVTLIAPLPLPGTQTTAPVAITLDEALSRAQANEPMFAAAVAASRNAALDQSIARAALLPQVVYHNQFAYTQGARYAHPPTAASLMAGLPALPGGQTFIANNGVHEYTSQASLTETVGLSQFAVISRASAAAAVAKAEMEISRRGLTVTVVSLFYFSTAADQKIAVEQHALDQANRFVTQTRQREDARESAHADVIKAQLTQLQRERDLGDAELVAERARLDLGVLLFPDPRTPYTLTPPPGKPLEQQAAFEAAARTNNPELKSAFEFVNLRNAEVTIARAAYLPNLGINFLYGIDASKFAANGRISADGRLNHYDDAVRNLGYSATATLDIPIFDWFATPNHVRQTKNVRNVARTQLTFTQRQLISQLQEYYNEAALAQQQLASLDLSAKTAAESLNLTQLRYTAGEATVLEVVDAQNSLTTAALAQVDGRVRYQLSLAYLQLLTGTI